MTYTIGVALAFGCALTTNLGFLFKHRGANEVPAVDFRRPLHSGRQLFGSRLFAIGMLIALGSWILHVGAMAMAPLSVVQAVLAAGIVLLAIMANRCFGFKVGMRQWLGVGLTACGLLMLGLSLPVTHGAQSSFSVPGMIAFEAVLIAVGTLLVMGPRIGVAEHHHGAMLGAASGIMFGVSDVSIKALTGLVGTHGLLGLVSPWAAVAVAAAIVAFFASAKGLQQGDPVPVIAVTAMTTNVAGIVGGLVVFGEPFPSSVLGMVAESLAFVLVLAAAWLTPMPSRTVAA